MEKKNKVLAAIALLITAIVIIAGATAVLAPKDDESTTLKIGVLPVIDTLPLYVGVEQGIFSDKGVNVELVEFSSARERDAAFTTGAIDGYFGDLVNTLVIAKSTGVKVITVDYHTLEDHRMFAILASPNSGITDLSELNGSRIASSTASISEYFLGEMLRVRDMTAEEANVACWGRRSTLEDEDQWGARGPFVPQTSSWYWYASSPSLRQ